MLWVTFSSFCVVPSTAFVVKWTLSINGAGKSEWLKIQTFTIIVTLRHIGPLGDYRSLDGQRSGTNASRWQLSAEKRSGCQQRCFVLACRIVTPSAKDRRDYAHRPGTPIPAPCKQRVDRFWGGVERRSGMGDEDNTIQRSNIRLWLFLYKMHEHIRNITINISISTNHVRHIHGFSNLLFLASRVGLLQFWLHHSSFGPNAMHCF
jgi:hypothetical protein